MDINLFAGAGGLAVGLSAAGFAPSSFFEIESVACQTLRHNIRSDSSTLTGRVFEGDVTLTEWLSEGPPVRLLAAGTPCQPFSLGGSHLGPADPRNLFPYVLRAVRALRPQAILIENVRGLRRDSMEPYFNYILKQLEHPWLAPGIDESWGNHQRRIDQHRSSAGFERSYSVTWAMLNAADYGGPQIRYRLFIVASQAGLPEYSFPEPTHSKVALGASKLNGWYWRRHGIPGALTQEEQPAIPDEAGLLPWRTVRDAFEGLPDPHPDEDPIANNHWSIPGARTYTAHTGSPLDWPSKTLKAGVHGVPGGENMVVCDDGSVRYYTLREMARIQTFPDEHYFCGARSNVTRQIGNAVPCDLATAVACPLRRVFD